MNKELVCIVCPKGCRLRLTLPDSRPVRAEDIAVSGNGCERGLQYARQEMTQPRRVLTTTVRLRCSMHTRLPVKTSVAIPKSCLLQVMRLLDKVEVTAPVHTGDIVLANVLGTGADVVATRDSL